ncbi:MAG TPA: STN domain-containing protein [Vitreimonas sp.]|uniref:STN domain-containing protein n=1 Tax=Vitreimonas sp. TaxID=3069702 RepID=UPI002D60C2AB|nr:STN domain-containing protein [Vitreimonas sp.]HYD86122.1 STN domain-containing protein [Vitreimonas sp.]
MQVGLRALLIASGALVLAASSTLAVAQDELRAYSIAPQPLASALDEFGRQSGRDILFATHLSVGRQSGGVGGRLTADEALRSLLAGTSLSFRVVDGETYVIEQHRARGSLAPASVRSEEIIVQGNVERTARLFARTIASASSSSFARWHAPVCLSVVGLPAGDGQLVVDHIARRGLEAGAEIDREGCAPNVVIVFAEDSDRIAAEVARRQRGLLDTGGAEAWRRGYRSFTAPGQPVRWWRTQERRGADGARLVEGNARPAPAPNTPPARDAVLSDAIADAATVRSLGTRLRGATRQELAFALIVVDTRRTAGADPIAVADFLAMAALAPVSADADMARFATILNLFAAPGEAPLRLTSWDLAYLRGLYSAPAEAATSRMHARQIADVMTRQLTQEGGSR